MKKILLIFLLMAIIVPLDAQIIKGKVCNDSDEPLVGANIFIKGSYNGTISGADGTFSFIAARADTQHLVVSYMGYGNYDTTLIFHSKDTLTVKIVLVSKATNLHDVTITAGTFEAGDKKRGLQLRALDILTTANSNGNIYDALNTMPGAQLVGEEGALFIRGGEKEETKTFVDGLLVSNPYTTKIPDIPSRGRFSPSLFSGVSFSSGGYSAEYGQALSSALILNTYNYPTQTFTSLSFMPFGAGINQTIKGDSAAVICSVDYYNMGLYYNAISQKMNWTSNPSGISSNLMLRKKMKNSGMVKSFVSFSKSGAGVVLPAYLTSEGSPDLKTDTKNAYVNTLYSCSLSSSWLLKTGVAFNYNDELFRFNNFSLDTRNWYGEFKLVAQHTINDKLMMKTGIEFTYQNYRQKYVRTDSAFTANMNFNSPVSAVFAEGEWKITRNLFARIGSRVEYTSLNKGFSIVPRISMAYKTGEFSQVSVAYGIFTQLPKEDYLKFSPDLNSEMAVHYIANYQVEKNDRLFRIEAYSKSYTDLVRYNQLNDPDPASYNSTGHGYARGMEIFFRDRKTVKNGDYWISYSYLDTRKLYQDFTSELTPSLFAKHTLNFVGKYYFNPLRTQFGLTYQYSSGRPYYPPQDADVTGGYTIDYHNVSANLSYLTRIFNYFAIVHFSVSNVFGIHQVFGYHYVKNAQDPGYTAFPIEPASRRFFVLALFITLDKNYIQY